MIGPFIFFDQMGPARLGAGKGIDVRPHPHIGLSTVTYLFEGRMHHRDSLGTDAWIEPGAVNLMQSGHGITHSERTDGDMLKAPYSLSAIQSWIALPKALEDSEASFVHAGKEELPELEGKGKQVRLILGNAWGARAPVETPSEMFYADAILQPGASIPMPEEHEDRGAYVLTGEVEIAGQTFEADRMMVFRPGDRVSMRAGPQGARVMFLGGETMDGPRYIWWNFVASSKERIDVAKEAWRAEDWQNGRFQLPPAILCRRRHLPRPEPGP